MKRFLRALVLFTLVLLPGFNCFARPKNEALQPVFRVAVRLYNYKRVPDEQVSASEEVVGRVLQQPGVELEWKSCLEIVGRNVVSPCNGSVCSSDVAVYLVDALRDHVKWADSNALGYSIRPDGHEPARIAYVSYPEVERLARLASVDVGKLLGLAVAHEMGHVLGRLDHVNQGIMRAPWKLRDLENKDWEAFEFTRDQANRIHSAVQARLLADKAIINITQPPAAAVNSWLALTASSTRR